MYQLIIVDDEVTIAEGVANLFPWREIGFAAKAFCDSTEAMKYIQNKDGESSGNVDGLTL